MHKLIKTPELPEFIYKSTLGVALITILIVIPFSVNNFIIGRYFLGICTLFIAIFSSITAFFCYKRKYHKGLNLFIIAPSIIISIVYAVHELGVIGTYWAFLGMLSFYFILPEKIAWVTNVIFIGIIVPVAWRVLDQQIAIRFSTLLFGTSVYALVTMREITIQNNLLKKQAVIDSLTGLYNRSLLQTSIERAIHQTHRTNTSITLLMLDLDHFKIINDNYGHNTGDLVLKSVADILKNNFRASDMVFRIGGEEFLILMHNTDKKNSLIIAEKLRKEIEQLSIIPNEKVTTSIGVSEFQSGEDWEDWMKICDKNLYLAKSKGRNMVIG